MLVFIIVLVALIVITGLFSVFNEKSSQVTHVAQYENLIDMHERVWLSSPEAIAEMKETLAKIKLSYGM